MRDLDDPTQRLVMVVLLVTFGPSQHSAGTEEVTTLPLPTVGPTVLQCGSSREWRMFQGFCYALQNYDASWYFARDRCHSDGAHLASILGPEENAFITALISSRSTKYFWIGLNNLETGVFKWVDGSPDGFRAWQFGQPDNAGTGESCASIQVDGTWNDLVCTDTKGFVCKKKPGSSSPIITPKPSPPKGGCPHPFVTTPGASGCFYVGGVAQNDSVTFDGGIEACRAMHPNATLASLHSDLDNYFVSTLLVEVKIPAWVGMKDRARVSAIPDFQWVDNTQINFFRVFPDGPKDKKLSRTMRCVQMIIDPTTAGGWVNVMCNEKRAYVCKCRKDASRDLPGPRTDGCPDGYQRFRNSCYIFVPERKTWQMAREYCRDQSSYLVSVQDSFEESFVRVLKSSHNFTERWLGLYDSCSPNVTTVDADNPICKSNDHHFLWTDGWPVLFTLWGENEPMVTVDPGRACVIQGNDRSWLAEDCGRKMPFVCEIHLGDRPQPPDVAGKCPTNQWHQFGHNCFLIEVKTRRSWSEADDHCMTLGGRLASIHDSQDALAVATMVRLENVYFWIGLRQLFGSAYWWSDDTVVQFSDWAPGYPIINMSLQLFESCVLARPQDGKWISTGCDAKHPYICKTKQIPLSTSVSSATSTASTTTTTSTLPVTPATTTAATTSAARRESTSSLIPSSWTVTIPVSVVTLPPPGTSTQHPGPGHTGMASPGLKPRIIAGVVIGVVFFLLIAALVTLLLYRQFVSHKSSPCDDLTTATGWDNPAFINSSGRDSIELQRISDD